MLPRSKAATSRLICLAQARKTSADLAASEAIRELILKFSSGGGKRASADGGGVEQHATRT